MSSDLCTRNKVDGYPQMNLYRDGVLLETYQESRDFDTLSRYLASHAVPTSTHGTISSPSTTSATDAEYHEILELLLKTGTIHNSFGSVQSLDESNFRKVIDEGKVFVKFFAPW